MPTNALLNELRRSVLPKHYRKDLSDKLSDGYLLFQKGQYVALAMPFNDVPEGDFSSDTARGIIKSHLTCLFFLMEKGLFLIYHGDEQTWKEKTQLFTVDKSGFHSVILQSIHFIDPATGSNVNSRTHWGPLQFGFCSKLIDDIEAMAHRL